MKKKSIYILILVFILALASFRGIYKNKELTQPDFLDTLADTQVAKLEEEGSIYNSIVGEPEFANVDILAVGDVMFHLPQISSAEVGRGVYDFTPTFKYVKDYISASDISLANYETVTINSRQYSGFPRFNSPRETVQALSLAGFDILSTANNHCLDQGKEGLISTIETIEDEGILSVGTYMDREKRPLIVEKDNIRIGILSYTYGLNGLDSLLSGEDLSYMINLIDEKKIALDIEELRSYDVDLIASYIHWGNEYQLEPSQYQKDLGRRLVGMGINIVLGSHPHVLQRSELIQVDGRDSFIIYSMGNFVSNQRESTMGNLHTEDGVMVKIHIQKNLLTDETIIEEIQYIPTWLYKYRKDGKNKFEIIPTDEVLDGRLDLNLDKSILNRIEKSNKYIKALYGLQ